MGYITQKFLIGVNDRTQIVVEKSYLKGTQDLVWEKFAKLRDISGVGEEHIVVPVEDEVLDMDVSEGYLAESTSYTFDLDCKVNFASRKKTILRSQYTDGPLGAQIMASFGEQMGTLFARAPEDLVLDSLKANITTKYDGLTMFNTAHLVHPKKPTGLTFSNLITAKPIHDSGTGSVDIDDAGANFASVISSIWSIPNSSGEFSRRMKPKYVVGPTALRQRLIALTDSAFYGAAGSSDVTGIIRSNGVQALIVPELGAGYGGSDTNYYLVSEPEGELGFFIVGQKENFELVYFNPTSDSHADEQQEYTTRARGRIGITGALPHYVTRAGL